MYSYYIPTVFLGFPASGVPVFVPLLLVSGLLAPPSPDAPGSRAVKSLKLLNTYVYLYIHRHICICIYISLGINRYLHIYIYVCLYAIISICAALQLHILQLVPSRLEHGCRVIDAGVQSPFGLVF